MIELLSQKKYDSIRSGLLRNIDMINNLIKEDVNYLSLWQWDTSCSERKLRL